MWVKVQEFNNLPDRRAIAIIRRRDFVIAGYCENQFSKLMNGEIEFNEEMIRKILEKTYGQYDVAKWQMHVVRFEPDRYAFEVCVSSPDFEPVEDGIVSPVIDSYYMMQKVAEAAPEIMRRLEEEAAVGFD